MEKENPFSIDIEVIARINGKKLEPPRMCATGWHPCETEQELLEDVQEELMEHYNCDRNQGWRFIRACFPWKTTRKPIIKTLFITLKEHSAAYSGVHFLTEVPCDRREINCIHPVSKHEYKLTIYDCDITTLPEKSFQFNKDMQFPHIFYTLTYSLSPELTQEEFRIQDCSRSDKPRNVNTNSVTSDEISSYGVIGGADGPAAIFVARKDSEEMKKRVACSSLHFNPEDKVKWRTIFYVKENEDFCMELRFRE